MLKQADSSGSLKQEKNTTFFLALYKNPLYDLYKAFYTLPVVDGFIPSLFHLAVL